MRAISWRGAIQKKLDLCGCSAVCSFRVRTASRQLFLRHGKRESLLRTNELERQPQYFGAYVDLQEPSMNCPSNCGGFIDKRNVADRRPYSQAVQVRTALDQCWVEAGYIAQAGEGTQFFWADSRPQNSSTFNLHIVGNARSRGYNRPLQ